MIIFIISICVSNLIPAFGDDSTFTLGTIDVIESKVQAGEVGYEQVASTINQKEIKNFNRANVGDALNLLSGVAISTNSRNEKTITVRGFDSRQVPLFIDGIPVYVPYDGYVDFNRFSTADLAKIQVAKGFSSMAYGPNTLGGAINLISRRPTRALEADATIGYGSGNERRASANLGTNKGKWYLQAGVSDLQSDSFPLSNDFQPTSTENGGMRNNSYRKDQKVSVKVGITPKKNDEYALSYYQQKGIKGQPPSTDEDKARYWQWPYWNKESLYFVSQTALNTSELLKARLYHDQFDNRVNTYTDDSYSVRKTSGPGGLSTGSSIYNDRTTGGSLGLESFRSEVHSLNMIIMFKQDQHKDVDANGQRNTEFKDQLFTLAAEDSIKLSSQTNLSVGISQHQLRPLSVYSRGNPYSIPEKQNATDAQVGVFHDITSTKRIYGTIARKNRMPTLKDRYSQRLGSFLQNPDLRAEVALNYELGFKEKFSESSLWETAFFMSDIDNKIQTVANVSGNKSQMQNADKVQMWGGELCLKKQLFAPLIIGSNYTLTKVKNIKQPSNKILDVPRDKLVGYLQWILGNWEITPLIEYNSSRWVSNTDKISGFTILNLKTNYNLNKHATFEAGINNLSDKNYSLAKGFPQPGRMFFSNVYFTY